LTFPRAAHLLVPLTVAFLVPFPASGQESPCPAGVISGIFIDNGSVFDVGREPDRRFVWAYRAANRLHVRTRPGVLRRELLVAEGDCLDVARLEDSERIIRALPFIADADVYSVAQADGTHHVVVETRDDWTFSIAPQWDAEERVGLVGIAVREGNLLGTGTRVSAFARRHQGERVFGASVGTVQLLGTPVHADLTAERTPVGVAVVQGLAYPFRGEDGRWAFRQRVEHQERNFEYFVRDDEGRMARRYFEEERRGFDLAGVTRVGRPGRLTLFGAGVAGAWTVYPSGVLRTDDRGGLIDTIPAPAGLDTVASVRVIFLAGQRNLTFVRRQALDAVRGDEDVALGVEVEASIGRSLRPIARDDDLHAALGVSLAGELGRLLWGVRTVAEGRRDLAAEPGDAEWTNLFAQGDAWGYWKPDRASPHTVAAGVTGVGGWRTAVPFQLTLGHRSGVRGLSRHEFTGERRVVGTVEHRLYLGWPYPRLFDLGSAVFVDAGRIWGGGAGLAEPSPVEASVGVGLRFAFPPGSRTTYRADIAAPLGGRSDGGFVLTLGVGQSVGRGAGDDPQLRRSSRRPLTASLFRFPR
jgi:hypothetical protein